MQSTKCTFSLKCSVSAKCFFIANWTFCAKFSFSAKSQFEICPKVHTNIYTIWYYFNSIQVCCLFLSWMEYQFLSWGIFWIYSESKMELFGFLSNIKFYIYWMEFRFFPLFLFGYNWIESSISSLNRENSPSKAKWMEFHIYPFSIPDRSKIASRSLGIFFTVQNYHFYQTFFLFCS